MSDPMFFCDTLPPSGERVRLGGDEARHAAGSRRLGEGDAVYLFDGRGSIARGAVRAVHNRGREIEIEIGAHERQEPPRPRIHLACALPKGDRAATLIDMATQLGMTSFTPLLCERSVVDPGAGTLERLRRVSLEACKQSRRAHLPEILVPAKFAEAIARQGARWIAHPGGVPVTALAPMEEATILIGPEGGFTDDEVRDAEARGVTRVALGSAILRVETAAVALLAALRLTRAG